MSTETEPHGGDEKAKLETVTALAERYTAALQARPRDLDAAITRLYACETEYEVLSARYNDALDAWAECDLIKARVKNQSVEKLIEGGMSRSAAEKAASDHEDYTAHRDKLAALEKTKRQAEEARDIAKTRVYNARTVVEAYSAYSRPITYAIVTPKVSGLGEWWSKQDITAQILAGMDASTKPPVSSALPVSSILDDPYENPTKLYVAPTEGKHKRGPRAPSELPKSPPFAATLEINESRLTVITVDETFLDYKIRVKPVERDDSLPSITYAVRGLREGRVMAGRFPKLEPLTIERADILPPPTVDTDAGAFVEIRAEHTSGYGEIIKIPISARLCWICDTRGGIHKVQGEYVCDECKTNGESAAIDIGRATV